MTQGGEHDEVVNDFLRHLAEAPEQLIEGGRESILDAGQVIAKRYRLQAAIGEGGFGQVWAAKAPDGTSVALKVIRPSRRADALHLAAFEQELRSLARVRHPGIVQLLDEGVDEDTAIRFGALELLRGSEMNTDGIPLRDALVVFDGLLAALAHIHARGIVHRDLKPPNVFLVESGGRRVPRLLDFGIAHLDERLASKLKIRRVELGKPGQPIGSLPYMSPEQASGEHSAVGPATDLYAVGIMLYRCLSGRVPFLGNSARVLLGHAAMPPAPLELSPDLEALERLIMDLLFKGYHQRPECASDVRRRLHLIIHSLGMDTRTVPLLRGAARDQVDEDMGELPTVNDHTREAPTGGMDFGALFSSREVLGGVAEPPPETVPPSMLDWPQAEDPADGLPWCIRKLREMPLFGREIAQTRLNEIFESVVETKKPWGVMLTGASGSGRGIVARDLIQRCLERGLARVLMVDLGARSALDDALRVAFLRYLRWPRQKPDDLVKRLGEVFGEADSGQWEAVASFILGLDEARDNAAGTEVWNHLIKRCARHPMDRPVVLYMMGSGQSDLSEISAWVESVLALEDLPLLLIWSVNVVTENLRVSRSVKSLSGQKRVSPLVLGPLDVASQEALIKVLEPGLSQAAVSLLIERCHGNPHFIRETLFGWHEADVLRETDEGVEPEVASWGSFTLEQVERQRLEALLASSEHPEQLSRGLKLMALLGRAFSRDQAMWCLEGTGQRPESLMQQRILTLWNVARKAHLSFSDRTMQSLLEKTIEGSGEVVQLVPEAVELRLRESLNALVISDWEAVRQDLREAELLLSRIPDEAAEGLRWMVLDAWARLAYRQQQVGALSAVAAELDASEPGEGMKANYSASAMMWKAMALRLGQENAEARALLEKVSLNEAEAPLVSAQAWHYLGEILLEENLQIRCRETLRQAIKRLEATSSEASSEYLGRTLKLMGADSRRALAENHGLKASKGDAAARDRQESLLLEALEIYRREKDVQGEARTYVVMTRMWRQVLTLAKSQGKALPLETLEAAQGAMARLEALTGALDDPRGQALKAWEAAGLASLEGDYRQAEVQYHSAQMHFRHGGNGYDAELVLNVLGDLARQDARWADALVYFDQFRGAMHERKIPYNESVALSNMAWMALRLDRNGEAQQWFEQSGGLLVEKGLDRSPVNDIAMVRVGLAECAARRGDLIPSVRFLEEALTFTGQKPVAEPLAQESLGRIKVIYKASEHILAIEGRRLLSKLRLKTES